MLPKNDTSSGWLAPLTQDQILSEIPEAIARLPDHQRKVVSWRYYDESSFEEIAVLLDIEPAAVRAQLRQGLNNMRAHMLAINVASHKLPRRITLRSLIDLLPNLSEQIGDLEEDYAHRAEAAPYAAKAWLCWQLASAICASVLEALRTWFMSKKRLG